MTIVFFLLLAIATISVYSYGYNKGQNMASKAKIEPLSIEPDDELIDVLNRIDARTESIKEGISYLILKVDNNE